MNMQNLLIVGALGLGAWWSWNENQKKKAADLMATAAAAKMEATQIWDPALAFKGETPKSVRTFLAEDIVVQQ